VNLIRRSRRVNSKKEKDTLGRNDETRIGSSTVLVQTPHCMIEENLGKLPLRSKSTLSQSSTCSETKSEVTPNRMVLPEENSVSQGQFLPKVIIQEIVEESYCDSVVPRSNTFLVEAKLENDTLSHPNIIPLEIKGIPKKSAPFSSGRVEPGASKVNELSSLVNEQPSDDIKSLSHVLAQIQILMRWTLITQKYHNHLLVVSQTIILLESQQYNVGGKEILEHQILVSSGVESVQKLLIPLLYLKKG